MLNVQMSVASVAVECNMIRLDGDQVLALSYSCAAGLLVHTHRPKGLTSQDAVCMSSEGAGVSDLSSRHGSQEHGLPSHNRLLASGLRAYTQHTSASPPKYTRYTTCVCDEVYLFHLAGLTFVQSRKVKSRDVLRLRCSKHGHRLKFRDANSVLTQECGNSTL